MDPVDRRSEKLIPKHGGYKNLKSYQIAQLVYDLTVRFCDRYIDRRSRTHDQIRAGGTIRCAKHRRGESSVRNLEEDRDEAYERGPREP